MPERLSQILHRLSVNPASFRVYKRDPVLVWEAAPPEKLRGDLIWNTQANYQLNPGKDPLVLPVTKQGKASNAFGIGVTLGRAANNDLPVDDPSVSRFHAFFQRDEQSGVWHVADAESYNGTVVRGERLAPRRPAPLADGDELAFGSVEVRFLLPTGFEGYLVAHQRSRPSGA